MNALLQPRTVRRPMTVRDVDAVAAVEATAYGFPWSRGNFVDSLAAGYLAEVLDGGDAGLLGYFVAMPGVDELHLLNITVAPAWQRRGLGSGLLDAVRQHAVDRGLAQLWLEVREGNHRARALYRRRGFAEVGLRRGYYPAAGGREDAVVMSLALEARDAVD
ncbi:MAG: ribosomal protein S18-alanine N-acetyltransferase [Rubrivivax sp.]|nr:ribosomal protein S18-alanine N-acetyltransferase [Rubrivivax sp.]